MEIIKTGAHIYITPKKCYVVGDAFDFGAFWLFRCSRADTEPKRDVIHFFVNDYVQWFDEYGPGYSTLLVKEKDVDYKGYEGVITSTEEVPNDK